MKKIKISLAAIAFVFAAGIAFAGSPIAGEWYLPEYSDGAMHQSTAPAECNGPIDVCATRYDEDGKVNGTVYFPLN